MADGRAVAFSEADELKECHQTFRAVVDQAFKSVALLATANAVLLAVAIEQRRALALGATAVIPLAGDIIADYLGRQFGGAAARGAVLEYRIRDRADGLFWMHLRSGSSDYAAWLCEELSSGGDASDIAAPVLRPTPLRRKVLRLVAGLELVAMLWAVGVADWSWA